MALVPAIPSALLSLLTLLGAFAFALAGAAVGAFAVAFLTDCGTTEAPLDADLGCLGGLCRQADPRRGSRESGSGQRLECVTS
jgi:hypothetical protein